jgi:hypothetical protein
MSLSSIKRKTMAILKGNSLVQGFSGMMGNIVFRTLRGKTIMAKKPRPARRQSALQREHRGRFRKAAAFAKAAMLDPQKKTYYWKKAHELKLPNAYTAAIADYMRKPVVTKVDTSKYHGREGDRLVITAGKMAFALASVEVTITDIEGKPLTSSVASPKNLRKNEWVLRLPVAVSEKDVHFIVSTKDLAGNISQAAFNQSASNII